MQANRLPSSVSRAALLAVLAASGCHDIERRAVREDRGPILLEVAANPAFDADASEVYYCEPGPDPDSSGSYRALTIADGAVRDVYPSCDAKLEHVARDGTTQWLGIWAGIAWPRESLTLRELLYGSPDIVLAPAPTAYAFSPAGDALLYYQADRNAFLRRLDTGAELSLPCGPDFAFSPGGDEVVCARPWLGGSVFARLRLSDLQFAELHQPDRLWERCCDISWTERGLRFSAVHGGQAIVFDPVTGDTTIVDAPGDWVELGPCGFTPDGRGYVVNEVQCLSDPDAVLSYCTYWESRYVLVDLETGERRTLASGETAKDPSTYFGETGAFAVSPDGRFIVYSIDRRWHWRPTGL